MAILLLLLAAPFDAFDGPLDLARWHVGLPGAPKAGALELPRDGWIETRAVVPESARVEVEFEERGGGLELSCFDPKEPFSSPVGDPLVLPRGRGARTLVLDGTGVSLDGTALGWKPKIRGLLRFAAKGGAVAIREVRWEPMPAAAAPDPPDCYRDAEGTFVRASVPLWDVEVVFLYRRGAPSFRELRAAPKGSPPLAALVAGGDGAALASKHASSALAMRDWGDERGHLDDAAFRDYLAREYALLDLLEQAQRALNLLAPGRKGLEALVPLAMVRHADNARAAFALAEARGGKEAAAALRRALGGDEPSRASSDALRAAAARAAREILGEPPKEWRGFSFDPGSRFVTLQRLRELIR